MRWLAKLLRSVVVFGLLGVATTVVVAWALAFRSPDSVSRIGWYAFDAPQSNGASYSIETYHSFGMVRREATAWIPGVDNHSPLFSRWYKSEHLKTAGFEEGTSSAVGRWGTAWHTAQGLPEADPVDDARGWPLPALWSSWGIVREGEGPSPIWAARLNGGIRIGPEPAAGTPAAHLDRAEYRALPLYPIWRGLAANTAIYAAAWAVMVALARWCRGWRRRRRGLCRNCGYDLRGDLAAGCPECGWRRIGKAVAS